MTLLTTAFAQGTHGSRPAASSSNQGYQYYETDTGFLFQSTGSAWQGIAPGTLAVTPAGLTGATAATRYVGGTTSGAPASGTFVVGDLAVDQTGKLWVCTTAGSPGTWTQAGGGMSNPMTTADDMIIGGSSGAPARLAIGSNGQVLTVVSGAPAWAAAGGGGSGGMTQIAQQVLSSATSPVTFSSIPGTYSMLLLICVMSNHVGENAGVSMRLNGDAGASYKWVTTAVGGSTSSMTVTALTAQTSTGVAVISAASDYSPSFLKLWLPNYATSDEAPTDVTRNKAFHAESNYFDGTYMNSYDIWGWWGTGSGGSQAPITSITLTVASGDTFEIGSTFTLYGLQ